MLTRILFADVTSDSDHFSPRPNDEDMAAYQAWLNKLISSVPSNQTLEHALKEAFIEPHIPSVSALSFERIAFAVIDPWTNPLNGPLCEWSNGLSPRANTSTLPTFGMSCIDHVSWILF